MAGSQGEKASTRTRAPGEICAKVFQFLEAAWFPLGVVGASEGGVHPQWEKVTSARGIEPGGGALTVGFFPKPNNQEAKRASLDCPGSMVEWPQFGQHTEEVLNQLLGYDWERIGRLRDDGVL